MKDECRARNRFWRIGLTIIFLSAIFCSSGCDERTFQKAKEKDTAEAYQGYLTKYPQGKKIAAAGERLDSLAFEVSKKTNTVAAYQDYIKDYQSRSGRFINEAKEKIENLRAEEALSSDKVELGEKFLEEYQSSSRLKEIYKHLIALLQNLYNQASPDQKEQLAAKIKKYARFVFFSVSVKSWYASSLGESGYKEALEKLFAQNNFWIADNQDEAQILVQFTVKETKGNDMTLQSTDVDSGKKKTETVYVSDIAATVTINHLLFKKELFKKSFKGETGLEMTDFKSWNDTTSTGFSFGFQSTYSLEIRPGMSAQQSLYATNSEAFQENPFNKFLPEITQVLLGEDQKCRFFYSSIDRYNKEYNEIIADLIKTVACSPATDEESALLAIITDNKKKCMELGKACMDKLCGDAPNYYKSGWFVEGKADTSCICEKLEINLYHNESFNQLMKEIEKRGGKEEAECLKKLDQSGEDTLCGIYDDNGWNMKNNCKSNYAKIKKAVQKLKN